MNMNTNQKKQEQLNRGIAIAVAVLLALTLIVTVIAFSAGKSSSGASTTAPTKRTLSTTAGKTTSQTKASATTPTTGNSSDPDSGDKPTAALTPDFICPLSAGSLVKDYSADIPVFSMTMEDYRVHCGIDIAADAGTEVLAAADGEITGVFYDPMMGQTVEITHEIGRAHV